MKVYPLGYAAHSALIVALLREHERLLLIDTRRSPASRWPAWTCEALRGAYGSRYHEAGRYLGNVNYRTGDPVRLADAETGIRGLRFYLERGSDLILLCGCRDYARCHRKVIVDRLLQDLPAVQVIWPETMEQKEEWTQKS